MGSRKRLIKKLLLLCVGTGAGAVALLVCTGLFVVRMPSRDAGIVETVWTVEPKANAVQAEEIARHGPARLFQVGKERVLYLEGTHYEMGVQHGALLKEEALHNQQIYMDAARIAAGLDEEKLLSTTKRLEPYIPEYLLEEMKGLADSTGVDPQTLLMTHAITWYLHCSGAIVFGDATVGNALYHFRSLDYALVIGINRKRSLQESSVLIVSNPTDTGYAHCNLSWAGFVGCVTGMNENGISVGEMNSACRDETEDGMPMVFMIRKVLEEAATLEEALDVFRAGPRTCGYNFLVASGPEDTGAAVELSHSQCEILYANTDSDNHPPHRALTDALVRTNHFVHPEMAKLQRASYDPGQGDSFKRYQMFTDFILEQYGKIYAESMVKMARLYPAMGQCVHQAIFAPRTGDLWISDARSMKRDLKAGAQNQPFHHLNLKRILALASDNNHL